MTAQPEIKFGTDGWRAVIADLYTFDNVRAVAQATGTWLLKTAGDKPKVIVGYDTRFLGPEFAETTAQVLASMGIHVLLTDSFVTTPAVSWAARAYECGAGVVITASHNPPQYNGFKIKSAYGGPASPEQIAEVEAELAVLDRDALDLKPVKELKANGMIQMRDLASDYLNLLREKLDIGAIREAGVKIAHDAMYGAGQGIVSTLIGDSVVTLHNEFNPGFNGQAPEPIERNLEALAATVVSEGCDIGLANDGDADRIGLFDENGEFVDSHRILSLLVKYLHDVKGMDGDIVKTFSTTDMLDKMGRKYGLNVQTTKIGFKYIAPLIVEGDVLVGGEESGGLAVKGHIPERDGIYIGLLIVEMMVKRGKKLSELVQELFDEFGPHYAQRDDLHTTDAKKRAFLERLDKNGLDTVAGFTVDKVETLDGFKYRTTADNWVMVRPSGTEPVLRIYAEAESPETASRLTKAVANLL